MSNTIHICGGLGNQLFQVCTLLSYSFTHNTSFHIEIQKQSDKNRPFYWDNLLSEFTHYLITPMKLPIYKEPHFHYSPIPNHKHAFKLQGYFQSWKYFDQYKQKINTFINFEKYQNQLKQTSEYDFENTINMHFRVGDYKNNTICHPLMPLQYYIDALSTLLTTSEKNDWIVLFFCEENDIQYVMNFIQQLKNVPEFKHIHFMKINEKYVDWEQMLIMSLCKHHIIANSSFSWWGAYLCNYSDKLVYYPSKWFGPKLLNNPKNPHLTKDLCLETWNEIKIID